MHVTPGCSGIEGNMQTNRKTAFLLITLLLVFVFQEVLFRFLFPLPELMGFNRSYYGETDDESQREEEMSSEYGLEINDVDHYSFTKYLNAYGFRGRDFAVDKRAGVRRILFVGDSFAEGIGADDDHTISRQFEDLWNKNAAAEAINLGVSGNGILTHAEIVKDVVPLLHPDDVFVVLCWNDLPIRDRPPGKLNQPIIQSSWYWTPRAISLVWRVLKGQAIHKRFPGIPADVAGEATDTSSLPNGVRPDVIEAIRRKHLNPAVLLLRDFLPAVLKMDVASLMGEGTHNLKNVLSGIKATCTKNGCSLTLVYIPSHLSVNPEYWRAYDALRPDHPLEIVDLSGPDYGTRQRCLSEVAGDLGISFIDTTNELKSTESTGVRCFWPVDSHCNSTGYGVIATACVRALERQQEFSRKGKGQ